MATWKLNLKLLDLEDYIQLCRWLEITCGEAPYMVTRYDTVTGEEIPLYERVGFLDMKIAQVLKCEVSGEAFYDLVKKLIELLMDMSIKEILFVFGA